MICDSGDRIRMPGEMIAEKGPFLYFFGTNSVQMVEKYKKFDIIDMLLAKS